MGSVALVGVKHGERGDGFFGVRIQFDRRFEFALRLLHLVAEAVQAAEKQMVIDAVGIKFRDLLVLIDSKLQDIVRAGAAGHVTQGTQINSPEKLVSFEILGITLDDVLRLANSVRDAAGFYVKFGKGGGQELR